MKRFAGCVLACVSALSAALSPAGAVRDCNGELRTALSADVIGPVVWTFAGRVTVNVEQVPLR